MLNRDAPLHFDERLKHYQDEGTLSRDLLQGANYALLQQNRQDRMPEGASSASDARSAFPKPRCSSDNSVWSKVHRSPSGPSSALSLEFLVSKLRPGDPPTPNSTPSVVQVAGEEAALV